MNGRKKAEIEDIDQYYRLIYTEYINNLSLNPLLKSFLVRPEIFNKESVYYLFYPRLFSSVFKIKQDEKLDLLCIAGFLYYQSLINIDKAFDTRLKALSLTNFSIVLTCQEESIKILSRLFDLSSPFWGLWALRKEEYLKASQLEKSLTSGTESDFRDLSDLKSAFGKVALDALFILSRAQDRERTHRHLVTIHRNFSWANQLVDDLQDLEEDIANDQPNMVQVLIKAYLEGEGKDYKSLSIAQLKTILYRSGLAIKVYAKARNIYRRVKVESSRLKLKVWAHITSELEKNADVKIDTINGHFKVLDYRLQLANLEQKAEKKSFYSSDILFLDHPQATSIKPAVDYLLTQAYAGFPEAKHIMFLGKAEGFNNSRSLHVGDIFQRALLMDLIVDCAQLTKWNLEELINKEIKYILLKRRKGKLGCWSYFPNVSEIAPDIDDLGQIIQLFVKTGNQKLCDRYCRQAIETVLEDGTDNNGGIKTWIIPGKNRTAIQNTQVLFNRTKWGEGPDVEVMANFLYGLRLLDKEKFAECIYRGVSYIASQQDVRGFWNSRWYFGRYYGTYVCMRLIQTMGREFIDKYRLANEFIVMSQNSDGGWGISSEVSDPLSTSLALLSIDSNDGKLNMIIQNGCDFLLTELNKKKDGVWDGVDFIKPRINEPYRSKTITAAYAVRALFKFNTQEKVEIEDMSVGQKSQQSS